MQIRNYMKIEVGRERPSAVDVLGDGRDAIFLRFLHFEQILPTNCHRLHVPTQSDQ